GEPTQSNTENLDEKVFVIAEPKPQENQPKKGRGRPKGSRNKVKIGQIANKNDSTNKQNETQNSTKPGDLKYNPSGLGPSST
ncbi:hypothetical protein KA017_03195, partial [Candidatus Woesebacteria bacterium]|nr:hypothetical protein [Candidatus Woesebacteria bacterium]